MNSILRKKVTPKVAALTIVVLLLIIFVSILIVVGHQGPNHMCGIVDEPYKCGYWDQVFEVSFWAIFLPLILASPLGLVGILALIAWFALRKSKLRRK
jgi:ABC-type sulfate transport system permease component